jgi:hypothetical protein
VGEVGDAVLDHRGVGSGTPSYAGVVNPRHRRLVISLALVGLLVIVVVAAALK